MNHLPESDNKTKPNKNVRFGEVNPDSSIEIQNVHQPQEVKNVGGQARSVNVLESSTIATGYGGPDITLQPATPGSSTKTDSGKSTAINENGGSPVKFRKQQRPPSPAPDRYVPSEMFVGCFERPETSSRTIITNFLEATHTNFHTLFAEGRQVQELLKGILACCVCGLDWWAYYETVRWWPSHVRTHLLRLYLFLAPLFFLVYFACLDTPNPNIADS